MHPRKLFYLLVAYAAFAALSFLYRAAFHSGKAYDASVIYAAVAPPTHSPRISALLSSCNPALQREECNAVAFNSGSSSGGSSGSSSCLLGHRSYSAGLGHQISEVLMWLRLARLSNASLLFEFFAPVVSEEHGDSYEWVNSFFGLVAAVRSMNGIVVNAANPNLRATQRCSSIKRPEWEQCGTAGTNVSCFESPRMTRLFATYAPCLRHSALCFGDWVTQAQGLPFHPAFVNVAWHIRVGSGGNYYTTSSSFYGEVLRFMAPFLRGRKCVHYLIGGSGWARESKEYVLHFQAIIARLASSTGGGGVAPCRVVPLFLSVKDSLVHMMAADVLVSSSSSFTDIAALFSAFPVVISPPPKHGQSSNMLEYQPDGVYVDGWTWRSDGNYTSNVYRRAGVSPFQDVNDTLYQRLASRFPVVN